MSRIFTIVVILALMAIVALVPRKSDDVGEPGPEGKATHPNMVDVTRPEPVPEGKVKNPWGKHTVGDFVTYKLQGGVTLATELVRLGNEKLTVKNTIKMKGQELSATETEQEVWFDVPKTDEPKPEFETGNLGTETLEVCGKSIECKVSLTNMVIDGKTYSSKTWMSDDVPMRLVKTEMNGTVSLELIDFNMQ